MAELQLPVDVERLIDRLDGCSLFDAVQDYVCEGEECVAVLQALLARWMAAEDQAAKWKDRAHVAEAALARMQD